MAPRRKFTERKKQIFINLIANGNTIVNICEAMGIDTSTYRKARAADPEFAEEVDEAKKIRIHLVEDALFMSAISGNVLAQKFYLVNRSGGEWKELSHYNVEGKQEVQGQVTERHEYDIIHRVEQYTDVYRQLARRSVLRGGDAGDDIGKSMDTT